MCQANSCHTKSYKNRPTEHPLGAPSLSPQPKTEKDPLPFVLHAVLALLLAYALAQLRPSLCDLTSCVEWLPLAWFIKGAQWARPPCSPQHAMSTFAEPTFVVGTCLFGFHQTRPANLGRLLTSANPTSLMSARPLDALHPH
jgi:hypothetical protein